MLMTLGEEIHYSSLKVIFENVSLILQLQAHECFND